MAFSNDYLLNVDIKHRLAIDTPIFRQGDNGRLRFKIYDNNVLYDLSEFTKAEVVSKLPSGTTFIGTASLNLNGEVEYDINPQLEGSEHGCVEIILSIYSGMNVVSVQPFNIYMYDNNLNQDTQNVDILKDLIQQVQVITADVNQAVIDVNNLKTELQGITSSEAERVSNEDVRKANEITRESNEQNRIGNEHQREQNETARQSQFESNQTTINNLIPLVENVNNLGSWDVNTQYKKNNIVEFNGSSFMALQDNIAQPPPTLPTKSNTYWNLVAQRGVDGQGSVNSVNGMSPDVLGNVIIDYLSVGAIPATEKGVPNGIAKLNENGKVVDALGNEVEGKVTSVNSKIGDVVLSSIDVGTYSSTDIDSKIDIVSEKIGDTTILQTTDKTNIVSAINEVFTQANDIKVKWADVIGTPLASTDTQAQLESKTQTIKDTLATNLTNKGQNSTGTEALSTLVDKVTNISTGKKYAEGTMSIVASGIQSVTGLSFTPRIFTVSGLDDVGSNGYYFLVRSSFVLGRKGTRSIYGFIEQSNSGGVTIDATNSNTSSYFISGNNIYFTAGSALVGYSVTWRAWE